MQMLVSKGVFLKAFLNCGTHWAALIFSGSLFQSVGKNMIQTVVLLAGSGSLIWGVLEQNKGWVVLKCVVEQDHLGL